MLNTVSQASSNGYPGDATSPAVVGRLEAIGKVVSSFDVTNIRNRADMTRALCALDLANKCVRVVLKDVPGDCVGDRLISESDRLIDLIEVARQKIAGLGADWGCGVRRVDQSNPGNAPGK